MAMSPLGLGEQGQRPPPGSKMFYTVNRMDDPGPTGQPGLLGKRGWAVGGYFDSSGRPTTWDARRDIGDSVVRDMPYPNQYRFKSGEALARWARRNGYRPVNLGFTEQFESRNYTTTDAIVKAMRQAAQPGGLGDIGMGYFIPFVAVVLAFLVFRRK